MEQKDTIKRSVVKTFFFKVVTTSVTALFTGIGTAIVLHLILTAFYLIYEVKRSIIKTLFFKLVTTSVIALFTGIGTAIVLHLILTAFYLIYERVWNRIKWGKLTVSR